MPSDELAHDEEMIPEHHKPSTVVKRASHKIKRASHRIKDGTYEWACEFNLVAGAILGSLIKIGAQFANTSKTLLSPILKKRAFALWRNVKSL